MNIDSPLYPIPIDEEQRLLALDEYHLVDTPPTGDFDRLAALAARLFDVPIVLISLVASDRQFFKAHVGFDICETSREVSFCSYTIVEDDILFIPDALSDPRFSSNPLVIGSPFIRFYAGKPLVTPTGEKIGTVCLIDDKPHPSFSDEDRQNLSDLAALIMERMELRRLDHLKQINQARFDSLAAASPNAIVCSDANNRITYWNPSAEKIFGYSAKEVMGLPITIIIPDGRRDIYDAELRKLQRYKKKELGSSSILLSGRRKDGSEFPAEFSLALWEEHHRPCIGTIVRDATERQQHEERLFRLASLDSLTNLYNRGAWNACLAESLAAARPVTVLLLDLDSFKEVNDTFGHSAGDAVLKEMAIRIEDNCANALMLARLGGDEFVALLPGNDVRAARVAAKRLVAAASLPFEFAGRSIRVGMSIGVSLAPNHSTHPEELLGAADLALYQAKAAGRGRYEMFTPSFREVAIARRAFEHELKLAFENGEFELFYQPQVVTGTQRVVGAEALMRWRHPKRGLLTPASFMDVLIAKPSANAVGEWVLRSACETAAKWRTKIPDFRISVNLFEAQLSSGRLFSVVKDVLAKTKLPGDSLELEIVENILLRNDDTTLRLLHRLRELGVGLAFDDYGTGFASLGLLKRYPVSRLKIDRSFIRNVNSDAEDSAVVKAIIYLGKSFDLDVIAEGVETQQQLDFLIDNDCVEAQGYLFGKPMPAAEFAMKFVDPI